MVQYSTRSQAKQAISAARASGFTDDELSTLLSNLIDTMVIPSDSSSLQSIVDDLQIDVNQTTELANDKLDQSYSYPEDIIL